MKVKCLCGSMFDPKKYGKSAKMCASCVSNRRRWKVKLKCIEYKGGKCQTCGYSKCAQALDFHHIDPTTKSFTVSGHGTKSWQSLQNELDKCVMLCANCHRELHAEETKHKVWYLLPDESAPRPPSKKSLRPKQKRVDWPSNENLIDAVSRSSYSAVGRKLGCSPNAVVNHMKRRGLL